MVFIPIILFHVNTNPHYLLRTEIVRTYNIRQLLTLESTIITKLIFNPLFVNTQHVRSLNRDVLLTEMKTSSLRPFFQQW